MKTTTVRGNRVRKNIKLRINELIILIEVLPHM